MFRLRASFCAKRIFSRFKAFSFLSDIIYHSKNKNAANAIFGKNNFSAEKSANFFLLNFNKLDAMTKNN